VDVCYVVDDVPFNRAGLGVDPRAEVTYVTRASGPGQSLARRRAVARARADLVHVINPAPKSAAALWGSRQRVVGDWDEWPMIRPGPLTKRMLYRYLDHWLRGRASVPVVCSRYLQSEFARRFGVTAEYIPYAAYMTEPPAGAAAATSPFDAPTAVYMGALMPAYDHDVIFEAAVRLKARGRDWPITFIGTGPDLAKWRQFVVDRGLTNVAVKGWVSDDERYRHLRHARVLLFPIRVNPVNLARCPAKTYAYAQARRPVVTCRVGEVPEVLGPAATYLGEPTPDAFADAIDAAMSAEQPDVDYAIERHNWAARTDDLLAAIERRTGLRP
jgi:glycosyltransferase involved in cell wall biosynthesis